MELVFRFSLVYLWGVFLELLPAQFSCLLHVFPSFPGLGPVLFLFHFFYLGCDLYSSLPWFCADSLRTESMEVFFYMDGLNPFWLLVFAPESFLHHVFWPWAMLLCFCYLSVDYCIYSHPGLKILFLGKTMSTKDTANLPTLLINLFFKKNNCSNYS